MDRKDTSDLPINLRLSADDPGLRYSLWCAPNADCMRKSLFTELWLARRRFSSWQKTDKLRRAWIYRANQLGESQIYDERKVLDAASCDPAGVKIDRDRYVACGLRFCPFCHARRKTKVVFDRLAAMLRQEGELSLVRFELSEPFGPLRTVWGEITHYPDIDTTTQEVIERVKRRIPLRRLEGASVTIGFSYADKTHQQVRLVARVLARQSERGKLFEDDTPVRRYKIRKIEDLIDPVALATPYPKLFLLGDMLFARTIQELGERTRLFFRYGTFRDVG